MEAHIPFVPAELTRRIDLDLLHPGFLESLLNVLAECRGQGANYYCTYGFRTFAEQLKIWSQGRTTAGQIVTHAGPGESVHNYGLAVDVVRDADAAKMGIQPLWDARGYDMLAEVGAKHGLQVGVPGLKDYGHVQAPIVKAYGGHEIDTLRKWKKTFQSKPDDKSALRAVWDEICAEGRLTLES